VSFLHFLINYRAEILSRTLEHLLLVAAAMSAAIVVGIPLGIALVSRQNLRRWVLGAANVIQTIPSLALFGFLIPVPFL
jgi:osmoprotectant transport system permease protein